MTEVSSFPAIASPDARLLILGSMPGVASLQASQYYAHPRNQFWRLLGELLGFDPECDYAIRTQALIRAHIALWDVLKSCRRSGSLDADIIARSVVVNDFARFFQAHPSITDVYFNGATAEQLFRCHVVKPAFSGSLNLHRLPSTSPANAGMRYEQKREHWRLLTEALRMPPQ